MHSRTTILRAALLQEMRRFSTLCQKPVLALGAAKHDNSRAQPSRTDSKAESCPTPRGRAPERWIIVPEEGEPQEGPSTDTVLRIIRDDGSQLGTLTFSMDKAPRNFKELRELIRTEVAAIACEYSFELASKQGSSILLPRGIEADTPFDASSRSEVTLIPDARNDLGRYLMMFLVGCLLFFVVKDLAFQGTFAVCWAKILDTLTGLIIGYYTMIDSMFEKAVSVVVPVIDSSVTGYFVVFSLCWQVAFTWPNPVFLVLICWLCLAYAERYMRIIFNLGGGGKKDGRARVALAQRPQIVAVAGGRRVQGHHNWSGAAEADYVHVD